MNEKSAADVLPPELVCGFDEWSRLERELRAAGTPSEIHALREQKAAWEQMHGAHAKALFEKAEAYLDSAPMSDFRKGADPSMVSAIRTRAGLQSWKDLRSEFLKYAPDHGDVSAVWRFMYPESVLKAAVLTASTELDDPYAVLVRMYQQPEVSMRPPAPFGEWKLEGPSVGDLHLFREVAGRAAQKIVTASEAPAWQLWLNQLRQEGYALKLPDRPLKVQRGLALANATVPYPPGFEDQRIQSVFKASADFCFVRSLREEAWPASLSAPGEIQPGASEVTTKPNSTAGFLYERVPPDDPNHRVLKHFGLKSWRHSFDLLAKGYSGDLSLKDWIDGCVSTVADGFETQVQIQDATSLSAVCDEIDSFTETSIEVIRGALVPEMERLGPDAVEEAITHFSNQVRARCAIAKKTLLDSELARIESGQSGTQEEPDSRHHEPVSVMRGAGQTPSSEADRARRISEAASRRQDFVMPILRDRRWKRGRWVTEAGVSKNSVYEYLEGKRNLSQENRKAMAESLGLDPEDLPE